MTSDKGKNTGIDKEKLKKLAELAKKSKTVKKGFVKWSSIYNGIITGM